MRVLVTGGAGYIGSHTVRVLRAAGHDVVVLDWLRQGRRESIPDVPIVVGDIRDGSILDETFRAGPIDAVVHLAAFKSAPDSIRQPEECFSINVGGTVAVMEAMGRAGVRDLIFSSTCAVYGNPAHLPVDEATPIQPLNPYGESKARAESVMQQEAEAGRLRFVALRYFNAAGAIADGSIGDDPRAPGLFPTVLRSALDGDPVPIYGTDWPTPDGTPIRDFVHVLDLAEAHVAALEHLRGGGGSLIANFGSGMGASVREVVECARRVTGAAIPTRPEPRRPGDPAAIWADHELAGSVLGWRPKRSLEEMMESAWRWQRGVAG
jgi:UDP-glucose 4-epimerase